MHSKNLTTPGANESTVTQRVKQYLAATLGAKFGIHAMHDAGTTWWVQIGWQESETTQPVVVGSMHVDRRHGEVVPLTALEIVDIQERSALLRAHQRAELARDEHGYLLPSQAKIKATGYVAEHIAYFAVAEGQPQWVDDPSPLWRVPVALRLRGHGKVCALGFVDVNALTGEVLPLDEREISIRQKRAQHAAEAFTRSAAPTS